MVCKECPYFRNRFLDDFWKSMRVEKKSRGIECVCTITGVQCGLCAGRPWCGGRGGAYRYWSTRQSNRFLEIDAGGLKKRDVAMALSACVPLLECNAAYARGGAVRIITKGHAAIEWNGLCARGVACSPNAGIEAHAKTYCAPLVNAGSCSCEVKNAKNGCAHAQPGVETTYL